MDKLRKDFREAVLVLTAYNAKKADAMSAIAALADKISGEKMPTPEQWVLAANTVRLICRRCGGTGQFITYVLNGVGKGPGGDCFRCAGKGVQTAADAHRNIHFDQNQIIHIH